MSDDATSQAGEPNSLIAAAALGDLLAKAQGEAASVSGHVETAKNAAARATESQATGTAAAADAKSRLADVVAAETAVAALRVKIEGDQAAIEEKVKSVESNRDQAAQIRAQLETRLAAATQLATEAEGLKGRAQSACDSTIALQAQMVSGQAQADTEVAAIRALNLEAKKSTGETKGLADKAAETEKRISAYEERLADLEAQCALQLKAIDGLLPGATSAGLAQAFDQRRKTFIDPGRRWQWLFVGSVGALVVLAATGLWSVYHSGTASSYDELARVWLARLPIAGAFLWLALHSSREAALAKRLEEDYGYKAAVASSFQGFHKQMGEIGGAAATNAALTKLCEDTLATIASPPGRIYDKHQLTVSPGSELKSAAELLVAAATKVGPKG